MTDKNSRDIIFSLSDGNHAEVAELADALDSKSSVVTLRAGSSPAFGTTCKFKALRFFRKAFFVIYDGGNLMFRPMRRKRQNLTTDQCQQILAKGKQGVLATLGYDDYPYAVPVNYVYYQDKIYIHCALFGHKIDAIKHHAKVSFTIIDKDDIVPAKFTTYFRSAIIFGKATLIEDEQLKYDALKALAAKYCPELEAEAIAEINGAIKRTAIIEITIDHMTGKEALELVNKRK